MFFKKIRPLVRAILEYNYSQYVNGHPRKTLDQATEQLMRALTKNENSVFIHLPGIKGPKWSKTVLKQFYREKVGGNSNSMWRNKQPEHDWVHLNLLGTTFSGHSTKTTLGNTLRSLCYAWYYVQRAGIRQPWDSDEVFIIASGDDVCIFSEPRHANGIAQQVRNLCTDDKTVPIEIGLGQCVTDV